MKGYDLIHEHITESWLLLDCDYLCRRAFHTMGQLSYKDIATGVIYGFLRDVNNLQDQFNTENVAFCFDYGSPLRLLKYPGYKSKRRKVVMTKEEKRAIDAMHKQKANLRTRLLKEIGFKNVFYQEGYEADDILAVLATDIMAAGNEAIIVSADKDLWQCLRTGHVVMHNPQQKKTITEQSFREQWGMQPGQWALVKAIAGCSTDSVEGIKGVGEKTAAKHVRGEQTTKKKKIEAERQTWVTNLGLVRLPYPGCKSRELRKDRVSLERWQAVADRYGLKSLRNKPPFSMRRARGG